MTLNQVDVALCAVKQFTMCLWRKGYVQMKKQKEQWSCNVSQQWDCAVHDTLLESEEATRAKSQSFLEKAWHFQIVKEVNNKQKLTLNNSMPVNGFGILYSFTIS